ncbi:MAG: PDZ domain-containing protein [Planctomycetes bacterium]|nr:PDZ domain-containing protein [Planctomycetota bacterium]
MTLLRTLPRSIRLFVLIVLTTATVAYAGDHPGLNSHRDFGISPDDVEGLTLVPTSTEPETLRDRLLREGILDDATFVSTSARQPVKLKTRRPVVEELPAPPAKAAPADDGDRKPPHQPTVAEKIQYRYADPRVLRLLDQLNDQSSVALYVEIARMIDSRHIKPSSYARRVDAAFEHLDLALNTASFQQAVQLKAVDQSLGRLRNSLSQLRQRTTVNSLEDAVQTLNRVQELVDQTVQMRPGAVGLEFVHAELDTLDQFSSLIPPEKTGGPSVGLKDNVVGIGVEVEPHADGLKVMKVLPGGPAADVQMRRGDVLTAVDQHALKGLELNQAVDYILGQPGVPLKLNLLRGGRRGEVTLVRRRITLHAVASKMLDEKSNVGYIKLESFTDSSVKEMDDALMSLHNSGMKSLVLDLRGNPGGLLTAAISISDRFLPAGTIVSTRGRNATDNSREQAVYGQTWKVPLVVLVDRNSASASEILAAAIQENGRGIIVGERSYGKGTVQTLFPLQSAPAGLRLTTAKFYSPEGREMAGAGVTPDLKVDPTIGDDAENDAAIAAALKLTADPRLKEMASHFIRTGAVPRVIRVVI